MKNAKLKVFIEDKKYTKSELINAVMNELNNLEEGIYVYTPDDMDNFYTDYSFKKVSELNKGKFNE